MDGIGEGGSVVISKQTLVSSCDIFGSGEPVLFIPGLAERRFMWTPVVHELAGSCMGITYDLRGYADNCSGRFSLHELALDAATLIRSLNIPPPTIVGHSEGGFVALELALSFPELVNSLIIVSSAAYTDEYGRRLLTHWKEVAENLGMTSLRREMLLWGFSPDYVNKNLRELRLLDSFAKNQTASLEAYLAHNEACMHHDTRDRLSKLAIRTLLLGGTADIVMTLRHNLFMREAIHGSRLVNFEGFGHNLFAEALMESCSVIRGFLQAARV